MSTVRPLHKLLAALALLAVLCVALAVQAGASLVTLSRLALGLASVAGLVAWYVKARGASTPGGFKAAPRMVVVQRVGLSARTNLALVEIDGRPFVVVHGERFARISKVPRPRPELPLDLGVLGLEETAQ